MHDGVDIGDAPIEPVTGSHVSRDVLDIGVAAAPTPAKDAHVRTAGQETVDDDAPDSAPSDNNWL
jgi:hypothetical protein